jgi:hypothetical protein
MLLTPVMLLLLPSLPSLSLQLPWSLSQLQQLLLLLPFCIW